MSVTYNGETINIVESISYNQKPHKTKQTIGKRCTTHEIIGADSMDNIIDLKCRLTSSTAAGLITVRNALENLQDGNKHAYADSSDSHYDDDYVIETGSLNFERQLNPLSVKFNMRLIQW